MKVTIRDIAKAAGVSPATVSNAFSGNNRVSEATRLRVLELARKMGYQDPSRPMLKKSIHFVIFRKHGRVIIDSPFFSELITGIESACRKNKYELTISYVHGNDMQMISTLLKETTRPILLLATEMSEDELRPFLKAKAPMVVLDSQFLSISFHTVHIDNIKAGFLAGEHFFARGHRDIGMITSSYPFNNVRDRQVGLEIALRQHGLSLDPKNIFSVDPTVEGAFSDMKELLKARSEPMPSGIFAFNDLVGAGVIRAMKSHDIRVPEEVSVIGMDNLPTASMISPALTSVHVPKYSMGYQAVEQLIHLSDSSEQLVLKTAVDVRLIERDSVVDRS
jgi:DNA-binding LacI/PurR family transcriptional regulator